MAVPLFRPLQMVLGAVRAAEEARLAEVLGRRARCLERAQRLRAEAGAGSDAAMQPQDAASLLAEATWRARLLRDANAEEARAGALDREAEPLRQSLALASGRERAAGDLAERAQVQARYEAGRRAETAAVSQRQAPSSSPETPAGGTGSPGIA